MTLLEEIENLYLSGKINMTLLEEIENLYLSGKINMDEKLRKILDEYYGKNNYDNYKEQIINFLEAEGDKVLVVLKEYFEN
ncbi:MAG: bacteriocin immunity protein [Bacilli bacterium]